MALQKDLREFLNSLNSRGAEYLVDILTSISGVDFAEAWPDRVRTDLDGVPVAYISRRHLVQNKLSTGRAKDLADVEELTKE